MENDGLNNAGADPYGVETGHGDGYGSIAANQIPEHYDFAQRQKRRMKGRSTVLSGTKHPFMMAQKRRMNAAAILLSLIVPWLIGVFVCWALGSEARYTKPWLAWGIFGACCLLVLYFGFKAAQATYEKTRRGMHEPNWYIFVFITSLFVGLAGGFGVGNYIYWNCTYDSMSRGEMSTYHNVDTSRLRGGMMLDAGTMYFAPGTKLNLTQSIGFKDHDMYCVAPIVFGTTVPQTYDFWVVGKNCCSPPPPQGAAREYHCGNFNKPDVLSATRLTNNDDRAFYRMAVQQAEAAFNINAVHPLFFTWGTGGAGAVAGSSGGANSSGAAISGAGGQPGSGSGEGTQGAGGTSNGGASADAGDGASSSPKSGRDILTLWAFASFFLQFVLVVIATVAFSTLGAPA